MSNYLPTDYQTFIYVDQGLFDRFLSLREEGLSYKEIGEVTGVSTTTVYRVVNNQTKNVGDFYADEE